ncbi:stalled ribosome sensor GCN1 [Centruroides vittatus]|uniref:stalled ribosome sensor GCN1 n=1 Tax=Centruroides vittatus TaxID=120091 RepID=UPI00350F6871
MPCITSFGKMADFQVQAVIKDLPLKVQTGKKKIREQVFHDLDTITKTDLPDHVIKGICRVLQLTLLRYNDSKSRHLVEAYTKTLIKYQPVSHRCLIKVLHDVAYQYKNVNATKSTARTCLTALNWTCLIAEVILNEKNKSSEEDKRQLVESQSLLLTSVVGARCTILNQKALKKLSLLWKQSSDISKTYSTIILKLEPSYATVILWSFFVKYLSDAKFNEILGKSKNDFVDQFVKVMLGSKVKPPPYVLENCQPILRQVTHEIFQQTFLPALQKSMLRNPEIILETVGFILTGVSLDLSQYAVDVGKSLGTHLYSKDDICREEAIIACKNLAQQCSSSSPLEELLKHLFGILNGSEGKLTVTTQRIGILSGIGSLSYHMVNGSLSIQALSEMVSENFILILKQEVHEGTLVHTLKMLSLWCAKFTVRIPDGLMAWFKTGISLKTSTSPVRNAYIQCMIAAFHGNTLLQAMEFVSLLIKTVEKAIAHPSQLSLVIEGLSSACLLLHLWSADVEAENKLKNVINMLVDIEKHQFLSEKFLMSASDEALSYVLMMIERLVLDHPEFPITKRPFKRAIIYILTRPSLKLRREAQTMTRKLISSLGGANLACLLLQEFSAYAENLRIQNSDSDKENKEFDNATENVPLVTSHVLLECLITLCSISNLDPLDAHQLGIATLLPSHLPALGNIQSNKSIWLKLLRKLKREPTIFLRTEKEKITSLVIKSSPFTVPMENAVTTLVNVAPGDYVPIVVREVTHLLGNPALVQLTKEEYNIFLTPDGQLYDNSVIENLKDTINIDKNIKRESKLYSYKEQLEELELRKELEEKKRAKGLLKEPELTKKQLEAKKIQLEKESIIRSRIKELDNQLKHAISLLHAAIEGKALALAVHVTSLVELLISVMPSPLCAPLVTKVFLELRKCAINEELEDWSLPLAYIILRVIKPACPIDPEWEEIDLEVAVTKIINFLHSLTCQPTDSEYDEHLSNIRFQRLSALAFAYYFPLLRWILVSSDLPEEVIIKTLNIISEHGKMRDHGSANKNQVVQQSPIYLPRKQMLEVLMQVIANTSGYIQQFACKAVLDVAGSGSGLNGCAKALSSEIQILLNALLSMNELVRKTALKALAVLQRVYPSLEFEKENAVILIQRIWVARFDPNEENSELANSLWEEVNFHPIPELTLNLLNDVIHPETEIQSSAAEALAEALKEYKDSVQPTLDQLLIIYKEHLIQSPPKLDSFGRVISESPPDNWVPRVGIAMALNKMAPLLDSDMVSSLVAFFVSDGLGDRHPTVRKHMLDASVAIVEYHGKETINILLPMFEDFLDKAPDSSNFDAVKQGIVILMGTLAHHLDKSDPKVKPIVAKLIEALSTPSQQVQEAVANCLPPLVPAIKDGAPPLVTKLLHLLLDSENYGERKGAAYGLAGLVKGLGIMSLKQLDIMKTLTNAIQDKKNYRHREGALFAFEMLCNMLGRLFEPYIVHVLPHLLLCFGDGNQYVREATDDTAKAVMSRLSAHGVKLVLPSLLAALEEDSWRTKAGSVELLGAMAFCAPKQLSSCLPSIVPKLIEVLSDSHMKVQKAGAQALRQIGSVIRNPEIQAIVPVLLDALQDPSKKTSPCLATLLDTKFVHFIDAPSLALIMPVVQRAFQDRSTETRKMAAQIIGNMYSLTDQKDLSPYLPTIIPGLKQSLLDPVPEVRSVSARALGAMIKGMGESSFEDLLPWLMQTLTSEASSVDRSGAAQGLSEVMGGLGVEKLNKLMPEIISTAERSDIAPHVKDGYIMMFIYLPMVFNKEFMPYIGHIITPILKALADENEFVRDTALKAGQRIVNMYADTAITLLLPELEKGLFHDNWRIRHSSVQLLGDLLYKISGVSGKMSTETADEDDNFGTEQSHKAILYALGEERRNRVLAGLYMGRSDVALMVRQAALHVWKVVVTNTPRTLRELLPTLFNLLLGCLASNSYDKRQVAARTLGDLVRKLGERVLPEIIPILERGLDSDRADQRQGVCIGLSEIMASTSREMVLTFVDSLVPTVRRALCDPLPEVRQAAAKTFDSLHSTVGVRALDDILPSLLQQLNDPLLSDHTLDGLRQVMAIKSKVVMPYLIPQLTAPPINTKALSFLSSVAGDALTKHLGKILPALLSALSAALDTPNEQLELEYCQAVVLSVTDELGVRTIIDHLLEAARSESVAQRRAAVALLYTYCYQSKADISVHVPQLLRGLIHLFTDSDQHVLHSSWEALNAVTKTLDATEQLQHVADVRLAVRFAMGDLKGQPLLPGFCLSKGITPILPIFREAILNGSPDLKEQAAQGLGEVIRLTSSEALKPSVVHITGPLIRILGDRFSWNVKVAVLETLALLLEKVGVMLKPFLPQLQTTFLKALSDGHRLVRLRAANALSHLIVIHTRCDPLFNELHTSAKSTEDTSVRETMLHALRCVIGQAGNKMSPAIRSNITMLVSNYLKSDDTTRTVAAACLGTLCMWLPEDELAAVAREYLLDDDPTLEWTVRHGRSVALMIALKEAPEKILTADWLDRITKTLIAYITADRLPIALSGIRGTGYYFCHMLNSGQNVSQPLTFSFSKSMNHSTNEVKQIVALTANYVAKVINKPLPPSVMKVLVPNLVNGTKEKNTIVKANSEFALVAILRLRKGDETHQMCLNNLDAGARDALQDVVNKVLKKVASQPEPKEEELDDTLLT